MRRHLSDMVCPCYILRVITLAYASSLFRTQLDPTLCFSCSVNFLKGRAVLSPFWTQPGPSLLSNVMFLHGGGWVVSVSDAAS